MLIYNDVNCPVTMDLICTPEFHEQNPSYVSGDSSTCDLHFSWNSKYNCPLCAEKDFLYFNSCVATNVTREVLYQTNIYCYGGIVAFDRNVTSNCHLRSNTTYVDPHENGWNLASSKTSTVLTVVLIIIGIAVLVCIFAILLLVFLFKKNRQMTVKYNMLEQKINEMDDK